MNYSCRKDGVLEAWLEAAAGTTALILLEVLVALLVWEVAYVLQDIWGQEALSEVAVVAIAPVVAVWLMLRASLELYVDRLRSALVSILALEIRRLCRIGGMKSDVPEEFAQMRWGLGLKSKPST